MEGLAHITHLIHITWILVSIQILINNTIVLVIKLLFYSMYCSS